MDIGEHVGSTVLSDSMKCELLQNPWVPDDTYLKNVYTDRGKMGRRYLNKSMFTRFPWLVYSHARGGMYCKYCALFSVSKSGGRGQQSLGKLVSEPLNRYDKLTGSGGYLTTHDDREYHRVAKEMALTFLQNYQSFAPDVLTQIHNQSNEQLERNKKALCSIVRAIITCGRTGIALRGSHEGSGILTDEAMNDGIFRELLRAFVDVGNSNLRDHLLNAPRNASYTSPDIQNQLINLIGEQISEVIKERIRRTPYFSIICDETSDNSRKEQLTLCIRYVVDYVVYEDFLKFTEVFDLSGKGIADVIVQELLGLGIDLTGLVGMAFDGASAMKGEFNGAQAHIKTKYKNAIYVPTATD